MSNLNLNSELAALDLKDRQFRQKLTDEERKKFSTYLMLRYSASVEGSVDLQAYYLMATNENVNKNFFELGKKHDELQWLTCTTVSPGMGSHRHQWIAPKKKEAGASGIKKQLAELFPTLKDDEIELMAKLNTKKDIDAYLKKLGQETKK